MSVAQVQRVSLSFNLSLEVANNRNDATEKQKPLPVRILQKMWPDKAETDSTPTQKPTNVTILNKVAGHVESGSTLAIMGASGTGKTSLLHCLALRTSLFSGELLANGQPVDEATYPVIAGYVHQEDLFIATITPREHLSFIASLTLDPTKVSADEKKARVDTALQEMGLTRVADILIGGGFAQMKGISGGEKKRLSIAAELIREAPVLLLDEPTSGLDSFMAETVVEKLQVLSSVGHTVIATIHQPSSEVFSKFSHVCFLVEGGRVAYFGPREGAVQYFGSQLNLECPQFYNPADFYIHALALRPGSEEAQSKNAAQINNIVDKWDSSTQRVNILEAIESSRSGEQQPGEGQSSGTRSQISPRAPIFPSVYTAPISKQLSTILWRTRLFYSRDPVMTKARVGQTLFLALMIGSMYIWTRDDDEFRAQNVMGAIFFVVVNQSIMGLFGVLQVFPLEVPIFLREYGSRMYTVLAYFLGRTLAELPFHIIFPFIFSVIVYYMVGFRDGGSADDIGRFFLFCVAITLCANAAVSLGYVISAIAPTTQIALAVGPVSMLPLMVFGGFFLNADTTPPYFYWLEPFSFFQYGFHAASAFVWEGQVLPCPSGATTCPFSSGEAVLDYLSVDASDKYLNLVYLTVLIVGFRFLAYLALCRRVVVARKIW